MDTGKETDECKTQRLEAMEDAKAQHCQQTASELGDLTSTVIEGEMVPQG